MLLGICSTAEVWLSKLEPVWTGLSDNGDALNVSASLESDYSLASGRKA